MFCRYTDRSNWQDKNTLTHTWTLDLCRGTRNKNNKIEGRKSNEWFTRELPIHVDRLRFDWESCTIHFGPLWNPHSANTERAFVYQTVEQWSNCCPVLRVHWRPDHFQRLSSLARQCVIPKCVAERRSHVARHSPSGRYSNVNQFHLRVARGKRTVVKRRRGYRRDSPHWLLHLLVTASISSFVHSLE